jgi:hypothetical protein
VWVSSRPSPEDGNRSFPKRRVLYSLEYRTMEEVQKPGNSVCDFGLRQQRTVVVRCMNKLCGRSRISKRSFVSNSERLPLESDGVLYSCFQFAVDFNSVYQSKLSPPMLTVNSRRMLQQNNPIVCGLHVIRHFHSRPYEKLLHWHGSEHFLSIIMLYFDNGKFIPVLI